MRWDIGEPCGNCPFRKDAPRAHWDQTMYLMLLRIDRECEDVGSVMSGGGSLFGCHKDKGIPTPEARVCGGWLVNQRERGVPSIQLRVSLSTNPEARAGMEAVSNGGHELFATVLELCEANREADMVERGSVWPDGCLDDPMED